MSFCGQMFQRKWGKKRKTNLSFLLLASMDSLAVTANISPPCGSPSTEPCAHGSNYPACSTVFIHLRVQALIAEAAQREPQLLLQTWPSLAATSSRLSREITRSFHRHAVSDFCVELLCNHVGVFSVKGA